MSNVTYLKPGRGSYSGSAGGPEGPSMEQRVARLEEQFASIDAKLSKLDVIESQLALTAKAVDLAEIKGQLSQMPKASEFAQLRADVSRVAERTANLPTSWQMIIAFLGVILAILWKTK